MTDSPTPADDILRMVFLDPENPGEPDNPTDVVSSSDITRSHDDPPEYIDVVSRGNDPRRSGRYYLTDRPDKLSNGHWIYEYHSQS